MKQLLLVCAGILFLSIANLPSGFYTFLRIIITIGSVATISTELKNGINFWVLSFGLLAILLNPLIPIYLLNKSIWIPIDIAGGILFLIKAFTIDQEQNK
ncbi:MAG: DUF6804 family protein [Phocaeicola sp.]